MKRGAGAVKRKTETKKSGKGGEEIKAKLKEKKNGKSKLEREKNKKRRNGKRFNQDKIKKKKKTGTKNEIKKKEKKMKNKTNQKGNLRQTTPSACSNLTCLNSLVSVLKFEKDTVRNFLAQEKRTNNKLSLMQNKQNRSDKYQDTAVFLEKRLGNTAAHKSDGPLCKGSYNTSEGIKVKRSIFRLIWTKSGMCVLCHGKYLFSPRLAQWLIGWRIAKRRLPQRAATMRASTQPRRNCLRIAARS